MSENKISTKGLAIERDALFVLRANDPLDRCEINAVLGCFCTILLIF